jgi:NAD+ kinase
MSRIGLVFPDERPAAAAMAAEIVERFGDHDVQVATRHSGGDFGRGLDFVVSLGGDGNMLRAVELVVAHDVPILGVNFGQLGYLTTVEPSEVHHAIDRVIRGEFLIERRMALAITVERANAAVDTVTFHALNEAVLERTATSNTIRLGVSLDGLFFTSYAADGMIVSTPTGSTAYAFSVRGPIVAATHRSLQLTPVSPHMLFDRTLVLEPQTVVRLDVRGGRPASLSVDGRTVGTLADGDAISCTASPHSVQLITFAPRDFHAVLKAKFGLNDR